MKLFILNGSPRRSGTTAAVLKELMTSLPDGVDAQMLNISGANMQPCVGCLKCRPDKRCVLPEDDAHRFGDSMKAADYVVIGSPVYWGNIPGPLKTLFDRNIPTFEFIDGRHSRPMLSGKQAAIILSSMAPFPLTLLPSQAAGAIRALKTVLNSGGVRIRTIMRVRDKGGTLAKSERRKLRRIVSDIKRAMARTSGTT